MLTAHNPHVTGAGFAPRDLAIIGLWGVAAAILAARIFRWTPVGERRGAIATCARRAGPDNRCQSPAKDWAQGGGVEVAQGLAVAGFVLQPGKVTRMLECHLGCVGQAPPDDAD